MASDNENKRAIAGDPYDTHCAKSRVTNNLRMHPQRIDRIEHGLINAGRVITERVTVDAPGRFFTARTIIHSAPSCICSPRSARCYAWLPCRRCMGRIYTPAYGLRLQAGPASVSFRWKLIIISRFASCSRSIVASFSAIILLCSSCALRIPA